MSKSIKTEFCRLLTYQATSSGILAGLWGLAGVHGIVPHNPYATGYTITLSLTCLIFLLSVFTLRDIYHNLRNNLISIYQEDLEKERKTRRQPTYEKPLTIGKNTECEHRPETYNKILSLNGDSDDDDEGDGENHKPGNNEYLAKAKQRTNLEPKAKTPQEQVKLLTRLWENESNLLRHNSLEEAF